MQIHRLSSTDAFIAFDLGDAPAAGVTRLARKVLQDGAELLARSTTYAFASFGIKMGGGSAAINADGDARDVSVASFTAEVKELVASGRWATDPDLGLSEQDLEMLRDEDPRPSELWVDLLRPRLTARGAVAAAEALRDGGMTGAACVVVGSGDVAEAAEAAIVEAGGTVVEGGVGTTCDVLFIGGKAGMLDHEAAAEVQAKIVVPLAPVPVTARAHAVLTQAGVVHVPDFLSTAAPLLHAHDPDGGDPVERVRDAVAAHADSDTGLWMAAVEQAETFLRTWQDELPFGRPLA